MKVAIMQPYLLPYIGYLQLLHYADKFVIFDTAQYIDKGWINRNRVLHPSIEKGWQYITYSICGQSSYRAIKDIRVEDNYDFFNKVKAQLSSFKRAPYFKDVQLYIENLRDITSGLYFLSDINSVILKDLNLKLELDCEIINESSVEYNKAAVKHPGQWALEISKALSADSYVNPIGGRDLFLPSEYCDAGINLEFLETELVLYKQYRGYFEPGLSVIDLLLWNGFEGTKKMVRENYTVFS